MPAFVKQSLLLFKTKPSALQYFFCITRFSTQLFILSADFGTLKSLYTFYHSGFQVLFSLLLGPYQHNLLKYKKSGTSLILIFVNFNLIEYLNVWTKKKFGPLYVYLLASSLLVPMKSDCLPWLFP